MERDLREGPVALGEGVVGVFMESKGLFAGFGVDVKGEGEEEEEEATGTDVTVLAAVVDVEDGPNADAVLGVFPSRLDTLVTTSLLFFP